MSVASSLLSGIPSQSLGYNRRTHYYDYAMISIILIENAFDFNYDILGGLLTIWLQG